MKRQTYTILVAESQEELQKHGAAFDVTKDTLKEAKDYAKYALTEDYRRISESSSCYGYSQVLNEAGECVADYFRKEP